MRIGRQVAHVVWKDVRTLGWVLLLHGVIVAAATANIAGVLGEPSALTQLLVLLSATIAIGVILQSDSAVRVGAFWTSRPLSPTAIVLAKLVLGSVAVWAVGVAGQLVALRIYDVPWAGLRAYVGPSAALLAAWLMYAAILAAVTAELRSFLVGFALVMLAIQPLQWIPGSGLEAGVVADVVRAGLAVLPPFVTAAFLVWHYHSRNRWRGLAVGLVLIAAMNVSGWLVPPPMPGGRTRSPAADQPGDPPPTAIGLGWARDARMVERGGEIWASPVLRLREPQRHAFLFVAESAALALPDGSHQRLGLDTGFVWVGSTSLRLRDGRLEMQPLADVNAASSFYSWDFEMSDAQRAAVREGVANILLTGRLHLLRPRLGAVMSAETGATFARDGKKIRIEESRRTEDALALTVRMREMQVPAGVDARARENEFITRGPIQHAVITEDESRIEMLSHRGGSGGGHGLVLPGPLLWQQTLELETPDRRQTTPLQLGESPKLAFIEWDLVATIPMMSEIPNLRSDAR